MLKLKLTIVGLLAAQLTFAQLKLPQVSGKAEVEQTIGYTEIEVKYGRPNVNNRTIFGSDLVPFGKLWRTGANDNTTFDVNSDISIEGKNLAKGTYAIFAIPNKKEWEVVFYKKTDNWGTPEKLDESLVALRLKVPTLKTSEKVESFTIGFKNTTIETAKFFMAWENTQVEMNIKVETFKLADEAIQNGLNENSTGREYFGAAYYYYSNNMKLDKALELINTAIQKDPKTAFYQDYKAKIEAKMKK